MGSLGLGPHNSRELFEILYSFLAEKLSFVLFCLFVAMLFLILAYLKKL